MDTYEKKYKELVSKIKKAYLYAQTDSTKAVLEDIMPELAESEDEKIRKMIINTLNRDKILTKDEAYDCVVWLEKQKSVEEIVARCKKSWYNEGKIAGMAEGLSDDEKYQQGRHDAAEKAVEWLYQRQAVDLEVSDIDKFVNEFKKAMKGGEE